MHGACACNVARRRRGEPCGHSTARGSAPSRQATQPPARISILTDPPTRGGRGWMGGRQAARAAPSCMRPTHAHRARRHILMLPAVAVTQAGRRSTLRLASQRESRVAGGAVVACVRRAAATARTPVVISAELSSAPTREELWAQPPSCSDLCVHTR